MKRPNTAQIDIARRLFAHEAHGADSVEECTAAAERIHQKIFARLASLLGTAGTRALFARSVKLTAPDFPSLRQFDSNSTQNTAEQLVACLREEPPAAIAETTVTLCATLLTLLTTLIGERLTFQVLRSAWPAFDANASEEKK